MCVCVCVCVVNHYTHPFFLQSQMGKKESVKRLALFQMHNVRFKKKNQNVKALKHNVHIIHMVKNQ